MSSTVLIVDDSLTVRMDLIEAFETAAFKAVACATLEEARALLGYGDIDAVILDVLLPDGNGVSLLEEIRSQPWGQRMPAVLLSTEAEVKDRIRGLQMGADEYVGKPYDRGYVVSRVRELLGTPLANGGTTTVLVIDDSATYREALREMLEAAGYELLVAESGEEGLRIAADRRPDAIIVDGVMPGIDGATVIRTIRLDAALRTTPCLMLTGTETRDAEVNALDAGADAFVRKESESSIVLAKLAAVLRRQIYGRRAFEPTSVLGPKKILAVDDSLTYLHELARALRGEGYDVVLASSGNEALDLLAVQSVDCVLLDLLMPGLSGEETCAQIKSSPFHRDIPLIILTAVEDPDAMLDVLAAGADDYVSKSSDFHILKARVRAQLRRKQFADENRRVREELLRWELEAAEARAAQQLAETRQALIEELERKNRELEAFSYSVSHDLRAPLRGIDGFAQALVEDYGDRLDERGLHYLQRVRAAAQRMGELIDDLLQLSRVGRAEVSRQRVSLTQIAHAVVQDLAKKDPDRDVQVIIEDDLSVDADPRLIRVALENLLGNAWKFTSKVDAARIELGVERGQGRPIFFVRDNGAGLNMDYADKLFRPFQRLHSETDFSGTGIGLATVHRVIDRHGGRVWAEGAVGEGATFYFSMQAERAARA